MRARRVVPALLAALCLASTALAQSALEQAKTFFNAGAAAYEAGQYGAALQAFDEAYRLAPRPGILFSMAQAHRRQFFVDKGPEHLRTAIQQYRDYLDKQKEGGKRAEAVAALAELEPLATRMAPDAAVTAPPAAQKQPTRLMVSSQTEGAKVSLDGGEQVALPLIREVKPGKHTIVVVADGYYDEKQEIQAVEGGLVPRDVALREKPARIAVAAPNGSDVSVDGRPMGSTPLAAPIETTAGRHFVAVTKNGNAAYAQELDLARGETKTVTAKLDTTGQRIASYVFFSGAGVSGVLGVLTMGLAFKQQTDAQKILEAQKKGNITLDERDRYQDAIASREDLKNTAGAFFGGALALGATGFLLYVFDQPTVTVPASRPREERAPATPQGAPEPKMEMSALPVWAPGVAGAAVRGTF